MRLASILWLAVGACLVPERLFALPILNEVFYDAEGSDRESAFTEILGEPGFRFDGFHLVGITSGPFCQSTFATKSRWARTSPRANDVATTSNPSFGITAPKSATVR